MELPFSVCWLWGKVSRNLNPVTCLTYSTGECTLGICVNKSQLHCAPKAVKPKQPDFWILSYHAKLTINTPEVLGIH